MRKNLFVLVAISLFSLVGCSQQETLPKAEDNNNSEIVMDALDLVIPTTESILKDGYPTNDNGLTYGPNMGDMTIILGEPDLLLTKGENGTIGYAKKVDLDGPQPKTPEEAVKLNDTYPREIPLYDADGETIIGKFIIGQ